MVIPRPSVNTYANELTGEPSKHARYIESNWLAKMGSEIADGKFHY